MKKNGDWRLMGGQKGERNNTPPIPITMANSLSSYSPYLDDEPAQFILFPWVGVVNETHLEWQNRTGAAEITGARR